MALEDRGVAALGDGSGDFVELFAVEARSHVPPFVALVMGFEVTLGVAVFMTKNVANRSLRGIE